MTSNRRSGPRQSSNTTTSASRSQLLRTDRQPTSTSYWTFCARLFALMENKKGIQILNYRISGVCQKRPCNDTQRARGTTSARKESGGLWLDISASASIGSNDSLSSHLVPSDLCGSTRRTLIRGSVDGGATPAAFPVDHLLIAPREQLPPSLSHSVIPPRNCRVASFDCRADIAYARFSHIWSAILREASPFEMRSRQTQRLIPSRSGSTTN